METKFWVLLYLWPHRARSFIQAITLSGDWFLTPSIESKNPPGWEGKWWTLLDSNQ